METSICSWENIMADGSDHFLLLPYLEGMKAGFFDEETAFAQQEMCGVTVTAESENDQMPLVSDTQSLSPKKQRKWLRAIRLWLGLDTPHVNRLHMLQKEFPEIRERLGELLSINHVRTSFSEGSVHFINDARQKSWYRQVEKSAERFWKSLSPNSFLKRLFKKVTFWRKPNPDEFHDRLEVMDNQFLNMLTRSGDTNLELVQHTFGYYLGRVMAASPKKAKKYLDQLIRSSKANSQASDSSPVESDHEDVTEERENRSQSPVSTDTEVASITATRTLGSATLEPDILEEPKYSFAQMQAKRNGETSKFMLAVDESDTSVVKGSGSENLKEERSISSDAKTNDHAAEADNAIDLPVPVNQELIIVLLAEKKIKVPADQAFSAIFRAKKIQMYDACVLLWSTESEEARQVVIGQVKKIVSELKQEKKAIALQEHPDKVKDSPYGSHIGDVITLYREVEEFISVTLTVVRGLGFTAYQARQRDQLAYLNTEKSNFLIRVDGLDIRLADLVEEIREEIRRLGMDIEALRAQTRLMLAEAKGAHETAIEAHETAKEARKEVIRMKDELGCKLQEMQDQARADREEARKKREEFTAIMKALMEDMAQEQAQAQVNREEDRKEREEFKAIMKALVEDMAQEHKEREQQDKDKQERVTPATPDNAVEARTAVDFPVLANQKLAVADKVADAMVIRLFASIPKTIKPTAQLNVPEEQHLKTNDGCDQKSFSSSV